VTVLKNSFQHIIETDRLWVLAYELPHLVHWQEYGQEALLEKLQIEVSDWDYEPKYHPNNTEALNNFWIPYVVDNMDQYLWYTNWDIVHKAYNTHIGHIGWGGFPTNGDSELGYIIHQEYAGKGLATEVIEGYLHYFQKFPYFKRAFAKTEVSNIPSQKVLLKNNFEIIQEIEEDDLGDETSFYLWAKSFY
jgi:RimJ/RimL family protein N-acetyltransferase